MKIPIATRLRFGAFSVAAAAAAFAALTMVSTASFAQSHKGGGGGASHESGSSHDDGHSSHDSGHTSDSESKKGPKYKGGRESGRGKGSGHGSLRDVFREMEDEAKADTESKGKGKGGPGGKGKSSNATGGEKSPKSAKSATPKGGKPDTKSAGKGKSTVKSVAEDSDRPAWAGTKGSEGKPGRPNQESGTKKGSIYGDLYVIVRDEYGMPILDADGYVQVYYKTADGSLVCCIPRDAEGNLLTELADGTAVLPIEVEFGRLSVGRSPTRVLSSQIEEAINAINDASSVTVDAAGRIVLVAADGTTKTIDSPLENLALYYELINTGTIDGVDAAVLSSLGIVADNTVSADELKIASSFFAAASDKTIPVTIDTVVYMNAVLGIDGTLEGDFVDYSSLTYDRQSAYENTSVTILVTNDGGTTWVPQTVNVYNVVFQDQDFDATNVAAFTAAADDARTVINYIHEYSVPVLPTTN